MRKQPRYGKYRVNVAQGGRQQLAKLTTMTKENANKPMNQIYPKHYQVLNKANLLDKCTIPTLKEEIDKKKTTTPSLTEDELKQKEKELKKKERERKRTTYFCVGYSNRWKMPIHKTIQKVIKKHSLTWLRVSMSYHRFTNLRDSRGLPRRPVQEAHAGDRIKRLGNLAMQLQDQENQRL